MRSAKLGKASAGLAGDFREISHRLPLVEREGKPALDLGGEQRRLCFARSPGPDHFAGYSGANARIFASINQTLSIGESWLCEAHGLLANGHLKPLWR